MTGQSTLRLDDDSAVLLVEGQPARMLAYSDDDRWHALGKELAGQTRLTAIVPPHVTLKITLPARPLHGRDLHRMIALQAPLLPRALYWTYPSLGDSEAAPAVTVVRRDWLDPRMKAVQHNLAGTKVLAVDSADQPFMLGNARGTYHRLLIGAMVIIGIVLMGGILAKQVMQPSAINHRASRSQARVVALPAPVAPASLVAPRSQETELVLLGIAGRLPNDADVLVKTPWGRTTTMRMGDTVLGWKLVSIAHDRIEVEKDGARDELVLEPPG